MTGAHGRAGPRAAWPRGAVVFLILFLGVCAWVPLAFTDAPQDDSYISYRYARNFARGEGFVWNTGEAPVEGYTNFLWTFMIGLGMKIGVDPELLAPLLGLLCTLGAALLTAFLARALGAGPWLAAAAALLFATRPTLAVHAVGGLETSLFCLCLLGGLLPRVRAVRRARDDVVSSISLAAAALTRPEGVLVYGLLELADLRGLIGRDRSPAAWLVGAVRRAVPFGLIVGAHVLWRRATYGDWVPNTFHAKVAANLDVWRGGIRYGLEAIWFFGPLFFAVPYFLLRVDPGRSARRTTLLVSTTYLVYVAYVGGDYMPTFRYLLPVMPLWCALAASSIEVLARRLAVGRGLYAIALAVLATLAGTHLWLEIRYGNWWPDQRERHEALVAAGRKLDEVLPPDAWMAATAAGRVPYFADRNCIDMMGLSDLHIARTEPRTGASFTLAGHLKGDGAYVLDRAPDVIAFLRLVALDEPLATKEGWPRIVRRSVFCPSEEEIASDPRFHRDYRLYSLPLSPGPDRGWLNVFARPGVLAPTLPGLVEAPHPDDV